MDDLNQNGGTSDPTMPAPVLQAERIGSLDVLRGVAVLGILVMNIQAFSMLFAAYLNPYAYGNVDGVNYLVWLLSHLFADRKFMTIFTILFGAGIVLMTTRQKEKTGRSAGLHYRRMVFLLVLGLIHAYLIWEGDILVTYALCGMLAYLGHTWRPRTLLIVGAVLIVIPTGAGIAFHAALSHAPAEEAQQFESFWNPSAKMVQDTVDAYRGSWLDVQESRTAAAFMIQAWGMLFESLWRVTGLMFVGMALFKVGFLSAARTNRTYLAVLVLGAVIGAALILAGVEYRNRLDWQGLDGFMLGGLFNYWGSIAMAMAWVSLVMLICRSARTSCITRPLGAVGQMAFTNYLMQSVICTLLFYGYGLGWYGHVERIGQFGIVLGVWAIQLAASPLWLSRFRFGPAEWLWRSLSYGKRQPLRR